MNRQLIAGNWKMNGLRGDLKTVQEVAAKAGEQDSLPELLLCVPATLVALAAETASGSRLGIGGQTCHALEKGAYTGDISANMLKEAGATYVILGHSERRTFHGETDEIVAAQAAAAHKAGLRAIVCVGETLEEREAGRTLDVVVRQLEGSLAGIDNASDLVVAYEPLWAIGTGKVATPEQIAEVHQTVRQFLEQRFGAAGTGIRILYGGSLNPGNAAEILPIPNVDGGLIGGASLKAGDFLAIYETARTLTE